MDREKRIVLGLAIVAVLAIGFTTVDRAVFHQTPKTDFTVYIRAAQAALDGGDIYKVQNARGWNYVYLPLFAIAMIPLAKLPLIASVLIWYVLSVALLICAIWMSVAMTGGQEFALRWVPALLLFMPLVTGLVRGQASILMLWLVVAAIYFDWKGRQFTGAICLASAVLLKVFPVVLLCYFVWKKRWRFVLGTLVAISVGTFLLPSLVFGWEKNIALLNEWTAIVAKPALDFDRAGSPVFEQLLDPLKLRNQSLEAVFSRLTGNPRVQWLALGLGTTMALTTGFAMRRLPGAEVQVSAAICWALLIPPVSEDHYFALLLLPVTVLAGLAVRGCGEARWTLWIFGAAMIVFAASDRARFCGALCWATTLLWLALIASGFRKQNASTPVRPSAVVL